jgi:hypothetical protein
MAKKKDYASAPGLRDWVRDCGFTSNHDGADALGVPHRTFDRWLSEGIPATRPAAIQYRAFIVEKMKEVLESRQARELSS